MLAVCCRKSLSRRGVALPSVLCFLAASSEAASAAVPGPLILSVVQAAILSASGGAVANVVSAEVMALLQGAHQAMTFSKCKIATLILLAVGVLGTGFGFAVYQHPAVRATEMDGRARIATGPICTAAGRRPGNEGQGGRQGPRSVLSTPTASP